jgi:hypothetical protein
VPAFGGTEIAKLGFVHQKHKKGEFMKSLFIGLVLSLVSTVSLAQLSPGPGHGGHPSFPGLNAQLVQELDVAKYDIRSTLQFLASSGGGSNTANAYLNDAIQRIERVQQALNSSSGPVNPPPTYVNLQVGELVYKGTEYTQGAKVQAINASQGRATIKSVYSGSVYTVSISDLYLTRGCIYNICAGSKVYKGSEYTQGATVLALNSNLQKVVIKSLYSGSIYVEDVSNLDLGQ